MSSAEDLKQNARRLLEVSRGRSMSDSEMDKVHGYNDLKSKSKSDPCLNTNQSLPIKSFDMKSVSSSAAIVDYDAAAGDHPRENVAPSFAQSTEPPSYSHEENNLQVESIDNENQTSLVSHYIPSDDKREETFKQNDIDKPNPEDKMGAPYSLLEDTGTSSKRFLSEPRCLTLKKYTGEIDPFLNDDLLILQPDFDSLEDCLSENVTEAPSKSCAVDDMFLDDYPKEEGELSPETQQHISQTKAPALKANVEFFFKINQCLSKLDKKCRDFHATALPEYCLKYLRRTLTNVDSIKRKLTYLLNSRNSDVEKRKKSSEKKHSRADRNIRSATQQKSTETQPERGQQQNMLQNILNLDASKYAIHSSRRRRSSREKPTQAELLNRKKMSILEKLGTKKEIERIQSLFKRQMNIINQHVIQKKETSKAKEPDKSRKVVRSDDPTSDNMSQRLNELSTLDDLENFFQTLKNKTSDKILYQKWMENEKNKGTLKFTSKREKNPQINPKMETVTAEASKRNKENTPKRVSKSDSLNKSQNKGEIEILEVRTELSKAEKERERDVAPKEDERMVSNRADDRISKIAAKEINKPQTANNAEKERNADFDKIIQKEEILVKDNKICFSIGRDISNKTTQRNNVSEFGNVFENDKPQVHKRKQPDELEKHVIKKKKIDELEKLVIKKKKVDKLECGNEESHPICMKEKTSLSDKIDVAQMEDGETLKENSSNEYESKEKTQKVGPHEELNIEDLLRKRIMILDDHNLDPNGQFRLKIIGNEVYLEKLSNKRKHARESKRKKELSKDRAHPKKDCRKTDHVEHKNTPEHLIIEQENTTLEEMEDFLQELRSKRKSVSDAKQIQTTKSNEKEMQFLSRIRAKRKAKLMAAANPDSLEREAKFLKALHTEDAASDLHKQKFMEKHKAETNAIVQKAAEDDPLADVKSLLSMIKEAESGKEAAEQQECGGVSFALKRSDMKRLESITSGKTSSLTEESQKFLNSVRSKLKAKKVPPHPSKISTLMRKPQS